MYHKNSPKPLPEEDASAKSFNKTLVYILASLASARVYSRGFVSAIRSKAVSCAVRRREPRGSHWIWGKAKATGDGGRIGPRLAMVEE